MIVKARKEVRQGDLESDQSAIDISSSSQYVVILGT